MNRADIDETLPAAPGEAGSVAAPIDGYQLGALIGRGGMGEVVLAHDLKVGRDVAMKRLRDHQANDEDVTRFLREARIQALLDHPAIVPVHDVGRDAAGRPFFTMKRVTGTTLSSVLQRGTEKQQHLLRAFVDVCLAIELAHTRRIVHRDLKPANIMLGDFGEVYILDWGLARTLDQQTGTTSSDSIREHRSEEAGATQIGTVLGTPGYMAPEQLRGEPAGTAADIFALGAVLFEILAGEPLYKEARSRDTLEDLPTSPLQRSPARPIAPELDVLCTDALSASPDQRPTARVLADRVQAFLDGDRDLARRHALAAQQLAAARAALAGERRSEAIQHAGRALALHPDSIEAAELVTQLLVEPPRELPPDLVNSLDEAERDFLKVRSRRSVAAYLSVLLVAPALPVLNVVDWRPVIAMLVMTAVLAFLQWVNARKLIIPAYPLMVANMTLIVLFSRVTGTLSITPLIVCAVLLAMGARDKFARRPWFVGAWGAVALLIPITLEQIGVLASTVSITAQGVATSGTAVLSRSHSDLVVTIVSNVLVITLIGIYAAVIMRGRNNAHRDLHIQAWALKQLLPRRAAPALAR